MALNGTEKLYMSSGSSYQPVTTQDVANLAAGATVAWADITGKPAVIAAGIDQAAARAEIGASPLVAATATALATGRTIGITGGAVGTSAAFNGTANVSFATTLATPTGVLRGGVLQGAAVADITPAADGTTAGTALNALLAQLRIAGIIAT